MRAVVAIANGAVHLGFGVLDNLLCKIGRGQAACGRDGYMGRAVVTHSPLVDCFGGGFFPRVDHVGHLFDPLQEHERWVSGGEALAGGEYFGAFAVLCGDMEYLSNHLGFPHWNTDRPCAFCGADRLALGFRNLYPDAPWKATCFDPDGLAPSDHPIWTVPGCTRASAMYDWMHTVDMGLIPHMVGSTLAELMREGPSSQKRNLENVWARVRALYDELGTVNRIAHVTKEMVGGPSAFACLSRCKAAELRALVPAMTRLVRELDTGTARDGHRCLAYETLDASINVIMGAGMFLNDSEYASLTAYWDQLLLHYGALSALALERGELLYNVVFKVHASWHIVHAAQWLNPRAAWAYKYEDFMHKCLTTAMACANGTPSHKVGGKVMDNYRLALALRLERSRAL